MNDKEFDKTLEKSFENFIKELANNPEKVFDNDKLQIKYNNVLKEKIKLQSNWNSLREWLKEMKLSRRYDNDVERFTAYGAVLDKMNELEGKDKE